jgi:transposase
VSDTEPLHKSNLELVRRLEVFTGAGRRRTWTAERKAEIVAESYESGEKVSTIARMHGLTPQQLFGWRRQAGRAVARRRTSEGVGESNSTFAPVLVEAAQLGAEAPIAPARLSGLSTIEIVIGSASIRVPPGTDAATLAMVLRAVKVTAA